MSIFGTIMSKVFGDHHPAATPETAPPQATNTASDTTASAPPTAASAPSPNTTGTAGTSTSPAAAAPSSASPASAAPAEPVDVAAVLDGMESHAGQTLDWRHSIVDLMKLLGLDSSLSARKELAHELSYTGDTGDTATMNIWLHKEVMTKFAENGGKLPADLH